MQCSQGYWAPGYITSLSRGWGGSRRPAPAQAGVEAIAQAAQPASISFPGSSPCAFVAAVSGANGSVLWEKPVAPDVALADCAVPQLTDAEVAPTCVLVGRPRSFIAVDVFTGGSAMPSQGWRHRLLRGSVLARRTREGLTLACGAAGCEHSHWACWVWDIPATGLQPEAAQEAWIPHSTCLQARPGGATPVVLAATRPSCDLCCMCQTSMAMEPQTCFSSPGREWRCGGVPLPAPPKAWPDTSPGPPHCLLPCHCRCRVTSTQAAPGTRLAVELAWVSPGTAAPCFMSPERAHTTFSSPVVSGLPQVPEAALRRERA